MARPIKKPAAEKKAGKKMPALGKEGMRVKREIILGHRKAINNLIGQLKNTSDPVQIKLLHGQIRAEKKALKEFMGQTR